MKKNYSAEAKQNKTNVQTNKTHQDAFYQLCTLKGKLWKKKKKKTTKTYP